MQWSSDAIATFARDTSFDGLSKEVIEKIEQLVLDSIGCTINASTSPPVTVLRDAFGTRDATDVATLFGTNTSVPVEYAALINSAMVRYLDYNDAYVSGRSVCHPSDHIPALISVAEAEGATGAKLIEAIVVAYEVECRGVDTGAAWEHGFDYVTWGTYSTAAAAGTLMGLTHDELVDAIGIAGTSSNGLLISRLGEVTMWKGVAHSYAVHNAIQACQLAREGMTGPSQVFDGPGGFFEVVSRRPLEVSFDDGISRVLASNLKTHACGYFMQSSIEASAALVSEHDIDPEDVSVIRIETFEQSVQVLGDDEKWSTDLNRETADHSLPYTTAVAVLEGEVLPEHFGAEWLADGRVHDLMQTVDVVSDPKLTRFRADNPGAIPAVVTIETANATYSTRVDHPVGNAKNPMSDELLHRKVRVLLEPELPAGQIDQTIEICGRLSELKAMDELVATLEA